LVVNDLRFLGNTPETQTTYIISHKGKNVNGNTTISAYGKARKKPDLKSSFFEIKDHPPILLHCTSGFLLP